MSLMVKEEKAKLQNQRIVLKSLVPMKLGFK